MAKTVTKLFKDRQVALKAVQALKASGLSDAEVGVLMLRGDGKAVKGATKLALPQMGDGLASGYLASALGQAGADEPEFNKALAAALGVPADALDYYKFGVSVGGVLVSVQADGDKLAQARHTLKEADTPAESSKLSERSPGFVRAGRMTATNPIDAPMSGDFRRY